VTAKVTRAVFDASVLVRAAVGENPTARAWTRRLGKDVHGIAPDLVWPEVGNAICRSVVAKKLQHAEARQALQFMLRLPLSVRGTESLVAVALEAALGLKLTVYDALYVVCADAFDATLVTADRRLADAAARAVLVP
jgi:predicted nucleic acid-binding protein